MIPQVIIRSYSGFEEGPILFNSTQTYQDKNLTRLQSLIFGIISIVIGVGLWKWKKWAFYGYFLSVAYGVVASIPYFLNPAHYSAAPKIQSIFFPVQQPTSLTGTLILVVCLVVEVLIAYYLLKQKKLFQ